MSQTHQLPNSLNLPFVEDLYVAFLWDPSSVTGEWRAYFESLANGEAAIVRPSLGPSFRPSGLFNALGTDEQSDERAGEPTAAARQDRVDQLIGAYRLRGHRIAGINPLGFVRSAPPELDPAFYGFAEADMGRSFSCQTMHCNGPLTLAE